MGASFTLALAAASMISGGAASGAAAPGASAPTASHKPLCESRVALCADMFDNPATSTSATTSRRCCSSPGVPGIGQRHHLHDHAAARTRRPSRPTSGARRHDLELPAPADVLVRPDALRHRVGARVHQDLRAGLRRQRPGRHRPDRAGLHRQAPGQRVHGVAVLRAGLRAAVRGLRLHRDPVLRRDDHRQPDPGPEHRASRTTRTATTTSSAGSSRSTGPTSPGAAARRPRRTRCSPGPSTTPNLTAVNPDVTKDLLMNPGDRIRIHMHDTPAGFRIDLTDLTTGAARAR